MQLRVSKACLLWSSLLLSGFNLAYASGAPTEEPAETLTTPNENIALQDDQRRFITRFSNADSFTARSTARERRAAGDMLIEALRDLGLTATRQTYRLPNVHPALDMIAPPVCGANIISEIPATNGSDSHIILGAHYDSVPDSPGANDNATGLAVVLAVARTVNALKTRHHTVSIVFFAQEEDGGFGSQTYAEKLLRDGINVHSVHTVDLIGWDGDGDRVVELDLPHSDTSNSDLTARYQTQAAALNVPISKVRYNSSDHIVFREYGFDAVCMSEEWAGGDGTPHHHKTTDTLEHVDFEYLAASTTLMVNVIRDLVTRP